VEVPQGFRNVAWLKSHEAQAIANAYAKEKTVPVLTTAGVKVFEAVYNKDSKETQKFHANVKASRIRKDGRERVVGWIRNEEALAVLQAQAEKQSIEFDHEAYGKGGLVEYFDPESSAAKTFLSTTRLLRRL
jgi:predicted secreted Zn-dependent protease